MTHDTNDAPDTHDAPNPPAPRATRFQAPAPGRVDKLVAAHAGGASRRRVAALFAAGHVRVDGRVAQKGQIVAAGATIEVAAPPASDADLRPVPEPGLVLPVLYVGSYFALVIPGGTWPPGTTSHWAPLIFYRYGGEWSERVY